MKVIIIFFSLSLCFFFIKFFKKDTPLGERVIIDGLENIRDRKEKELNPKQNILEKCLAVMKTDNNGLATFAGC